MRHDLPHLHRTRQSACRLDGIQVLAVGAGGGVAPGAGVHRRHRGGGAQEFHRARADREDGLVHPAELAGIGVHVHDLLPRARRHDEPVATGRHLAEPGTDDQQQVGVAHPLGEPGIDAEPEVAGVAGMGVVEAILAAERRRGGERIRVHESSEVLARPRGPASAAHDDQRSLRALEQHAQCRNHTARDPRRNLGVPARVLDGGLLDQHVLRQCDRHRPGPPGARSMKRLAHELRNSSRVVDLRHPLAQRLEKSPVLDLLERLPIRMPALDLADEHHHGGRVLRGVVEADRRVACAGTTRHHDDAGPAGELAVGFRHVRGAAFVPARDCRDGAARVVEGIEGGEIALARHAEDGVHAVYSERVDQHPAAGAPAVLRHVRHGMGKGP